MKRFVLTWYKLKTVKTDVTEIKFYKQQLKFANALKLNTSHKYFSIPIAGRAQCYASVFFEYSITYTQA